MIFFRTMFRDRAESDIGTGFTVITVALLVGVGTAVIVGFTLTRSLDVIWRRGVIGGLGVFGAALLAGLAAPADRIAGRLGMSVYLVVLIVVAILFCRAAIRAAAR
jgi:hypothetical protein